MDVKVLGCGPIRTGKGAAAPFIGVHILGKIRPAGGFDTLAESRWEDRIGPSIPVQKINHNTINHQGPLYGRRIGRGMERRPCLWRRILRGIFDAWGGWKAWPIGDRAVHFNHKNTTIKLSSARLGLNRPGNGEAVAFCGVHFFGIMASGGVLRHLSIATGRTNLFAPPGP
jgi:hypothetical protein